MSSPTSARRTSRSRRTPFLRVAGAALGGLLALGGGLAFAAPAQAAAQDATFALSPVTGPTTNFPNGKVVVSTDFACAADGTSARAFVTTPGAEIVPVPNATTPYFGTYDLVNYQDVGRGESGEVLSPSSVFSLSFSSKDFISAGLDTWLKPDMSYSIGFVCVTESDDLYLAADADGNSIATWGTLSIDSNKNYTFKAATKASTLDASAQAAGAYAATVSASVKSGGQTATDATGSVEFFEAGASVGTAPVTGGVAMLPLSGLSVGVHSYTASYTPAGDSPYSASQTTAAASVTVDLVKLDTTVGLTGELQGENAAAFTATVTSAGGTASSATGAVEFFDGATKLGSADLAAGVASYTATALAAGATHQITAKYLGDSAYNASPASASVAIVVPAAPVVLVAGATVTPGTRYSYTAPAGSFTADETVTGEIHSAPIKLAETATAAADGSAIYVFTVPSALAAGDHSLILTGGRSDATVSVAFVVAAAAANDPGTTSPGSTTPGASGSNAAALFHTDWVGEAAGSNPVGFIAAIAALLALAAGAAAAGLKLRRSKRTRA
ncbi:Ig-like domain (group 3) [Agreia bicolorata]|uniref:Ig-like domain (Group 3) n=1 Tax=Agreia bicolorata TaxID=110935 RepID=A0A1T4WVG6_9MICO|nr:Ig-like domain-containing protein [Agreia bicolorata]SKA81304.1 Ig-like domain (group 3) [Agreia bicolorata]